MKFVVLFLALLATVLADDDCSYVSSDKQWFYDLSNLKLSVGKPHTAAGSNGETYYFNFCEDLDDLKDDATIQCAEDSASCMKTAQGNFINLGSEDDYLFADSPYGTDQGLELTYGSGETCKEDTSVLYKTMITLNCSKTDTFTVVTASTDKCFTTIEIRSIYACPVAYSDVDDGYYYRRHHGSPVFFTFFLLSLICCCISLCCCCVRRYKKCRRECSTRSCCRRNTTTTHNNRDYTAVEFQTFNDGQVESQIPVYFVPQQNGQYVPPMYYAPQPVDQVANDEALARKLQAELNNA